MSLDVFLEILGPLEGLAAEFASMRFQRYVDPDVRGDMITFHYGNTAAAPGAG